MSDILEYLLRSGVAARSYCASVVRCDLKRTVEGGRGKSETAEVVRSEGRHRLSQRTRVFGFLDAAAGVRQEASVSIAIPRVSDAQDVPRLREQRRSRSRVALSDR